MRRYADTKMVETEAGYKLNYSEPTMCAQRQSTMHCKLPCADLLGAVLAACTPCAASSAHVSADMRA